MCHPEEIGPYRCTSVISEIIGDPFRSTSLFPSRSEFVGAIIEWPFAVIDWPFDLVADTIMYPYDHYVFTRGEKKGETE